MQDIIIYGIGGMAKETVYLIEKINSVKENFKFVGFSVDDTYFSDNMQVLGYPVFKREWLIDHKNDVVCACGIGYPKDRRAVMNSLEKDGVRFTTLIHPTASIIDKSLVGNGSIIGAYCSASVDVKIGKGVFLNGDLVAIGHDAVLEDYVTCFPKAQISGGCVIGEAALIGSLSYIHEKKKVGREAVVAPGSIVMRNVKDGVHVFGNPAKVVNI
ncbi:acetyltransferase [Butyrivibrio proteoclasticus]|uniref:acetyltransferase n=1 Tax=Butyrivibrio proteoclasticus TaxID=43305 RepID=UPI00047B0E05|nr:acetyltransferase [Butyrivibrio proteoclasticus]